MVLAATLMLRAKLTKNALLLILPANGNTSTDDFLYALI